MLAETLILALFLLMAFAIGLARHHDPRTATLEEHPIRQAILNVLRTVPGANLVEVCRRLESHRGTVSHHINLLEQSDHINSVPQGRERRFFLKDEFQGSRRKISLIRREGIGRLVRVVLEQPGIIQKELTRKASMTRKALRRYVDLLSDEGLLDEVPRARTRRYYPTETLHQVMALVDAPPHDAQPKHDDVAAPGGPERPR